MTSRSKFVPSADFQKELAKDPEVIEVLSVAADEAAAEARQVASSFTDTGAYVDSIRSEKNYLIADDPGAIYIEFGTKFNEPKAPLRRGIEASGARFGR